MSKKKAIDVKNLQAVNTRNPDGLFTEVFGDIGDKAAPPFTFEEGFPQIYSDPPPAGKGPERTAINYLYNQLYALGTDINKFGGALPWDTTLTYEEGAIVTYFVAGEQNYLYIALQQTQGDQPDLVGASWQKVPDEPTINGYIQTLQSNAGAGIIGTTSGNTVQQELDSASKTEIVAAARVPSGGNPLDATTLLNVSSVTKPADFYLVQFTNPIDITTTIPLATIWDEPSTVVLRNFSANSIELGSWDQNQSFYKNDAWTLAIQSIV